MNPLKESPSETEGPAEDAQPGDAQADATAPADSSALRGDKKSKGMDISKMSLQEMMDKLGGLPPLKSGDVDPSTPSEQAILQWFVSQNILNTRIKDALGQLSAKDMLGARQAADVIAMMATSKRAQGGGPVPPPQPAQEQQPDAMQQGGMPSAGQ